MSGKKEAQTVSYEKSEKARINSIESFGAVDGPGVRFVFFLQGCRMRCAYCHNPETWGMELPKSAEAMTLTPQEAFDMAYRYHAYWKRGGGITVSGGEAMLQIGWVTKLFRIAKEHGVSTALDTAGEPFRGEDPAFMEMFRALFAVTDLFILDIKMMDEKKHIELTGCSNRNILAMARCISDMGGHMWIRRVLVPGLTDGADELAATKAFIDSLHGVDRVEVLPYHTLGVAKYEKLGIPYRLKDARVPTAEEVKLAEEQLGI